MMSSPATIAHADRELRRELEAITDPALRRECLAAFDSVPTGGTERERQAWANGFREAVWALRPEAFDAASMAAEIAGEERLS